jgi:hypothetical protein
MMRPSSTVCDLLKQEGFPVTKLRGLTLLDVIQAVSEVAANDQETVATVVHLISSGQVRLSDEAVRAMRDLLMTADVAA